MKVQIVTLFPEMFEGVFDHSMMLKAKKNSQLEVEFIQLRDFGVGPRKQVDDTPYGGGDGMLLMIEPLTKAVESAKQKTKSSNPKVLLMTPRGDTFRQAKAMELSKEQDLIIICSRYEGYDERVVDLVDEQISIGNYVLTGGEIPAMVLVDSVVRLIPGVLGGETSAEKESFSEDPNRIEHPQYTRPEEFEGKKVPDILLSGNHGEIEKWRQANSKAADTN